MRDEPWIEPEKGVTAFLAALEALWHGSRLGVQPLRFDGVPRCAEELVPRHAHARNLHEQFARDQKLRVQELRFLHQWLWRFVFHGRSVRGGVSCPRPFCPGR